MKIIVNSGNIGTPVALELARSAMLKAGVPTWLADLITELNELGRAGYLAPVRTDTETILKRKPITFERFVQDHLAAFKN